MTPAEHDEWEELATRVGARGALHILDPANFPRIKIGRFDAQVRIGQGGFGVVFKVFDPEFKRWVALKLCSRSPSAIEGLMEEASWLAELNHPNIVAVYEPGEHEGAKFFVMPYIDGQNAAEFARRTPRPTWRETLAVYIGVAKGLAAAHRKGVVHRDIKPSNILLDRDDFPRIADFGLAWRLIEDAAEPDQEGLRRRAGTLYYMAPEALRGKRGDARSDQFSFFVALVQTLTGSLPFDGESSGELLEAIKTTVVQFDDPRIPQGLIAAVRIGLSEDPGQRFPSMDVVAAELERVLLSAPDESVELRPVADAAEQQRARVVPRGVYVAAITVVGVACLAIGRVTVERPPEVSRPIELPYPHNLDSMCAMGDEEVTIADEELQKTCEQIRHGQLDSAQTRWDNAFNEKIVSGDVSKLAENTLIVARTFVEHAIATQHTGPEDAVRAAKLGARWADRADDLIDPREGPNDPRVIEIKNGAAPFLPP